MGRYGNQCFQWVFAKLLSEKNNLKIDTSPPDFFYEIKDSQDGESGTGDTIHVSDLCGAKPLSLLEHDYRGKIVEIRGYFQDSDLYRDKDKIKSLFNIPAILNKNTDDIVVNLRLQDYQRKEIRSVIDVSWYKKILHEEKYKKCFVVVEPHSTNERYLKKLLSSISGKVQFVRGTPKQQFDFIRSFDRIVTCNSTFSWLAAYLSDASKIWTFKPWMRTSPSNLAFMPFAIVTDGIYAPDDKTLQRYDWDKYLRERNG
jgi:hypothetical protein